MEQTKKVFKAIEKYDKMTIEQLQKLTDEEYEAYRTYLIKKKRFKESQKK